MACNVWDENTYPFPNFDWCTVETWEWWCNYIPHLLIDVITYTCWIKLINVNKRCQKEAKFTIPIFPITYNISFYWLSGAFDGSCHSTNNRRMIYSRYKTRGPNMVYQAGLLPYWLTFLEKQWMQSKYQQQNIVKSHLTRSMTCLLVKLKHETMATIILPEHKDTPR